MTPNSRSASLLESAAVGSSMTKRRPRPDPSSTKVEAILTMIWSAVGNRPRMAPGAIMEHAPVDQSEQPGRIGAAEKEIFSDVQPRQDVQLLMQETQTETMGVARAQDRDRRTVN